MKDAPIYQNNIVLLNGYHPAYNEKKDYKKGKQPIPTCTGWTSEDYKNPSAEHVNRHITVGGWIGHLIPSNQHALDIEDPDTIRLVRSVCDHHGIKPPINHTQNGLQFLFTTNGGPPLTGNSNRRTRLGAPVTDRAALKNYLILPKMLDRYWENQEALYNPPVIPDEFLPQRNTLEDVAKELAWELGRAYRAGQLAGFDDLDGALMSFCVEIDMLEELICEVFHLVFLDAYSERQTLAMLLRTKKRREEGEKLTGTGTLVKTLQGKGMEKIIPVIQRIERLAGKKTQKKGKKDQGPKTVLSATLPSLVDLVDDDGAPAYLILKDGDLKIARSVENAGIFTQPPGKEHLPFPLVPATDVIRHFPDADTGLFDEVLNHLQQYAYLTDEQWLICAVYVFASYLHEHPEIQYTGILFFYAVPERGKTRTGKALTYVSYRGVHCVDLRETNLFRYSQELRSTLFLDIMDLWKKAERNQSEDVLLLRYEKGATVARVLYPEKGAFNDTKYYRVYGPTIMASNQPVHKILDTRCLTFQMPNKPGRYDNPTPEKALPLRAKLTAWRARHMEGPLPSVAPVEGILGRLWDITQPLLQICKMVAPERYDALVEAILNVATDRTEEKQTSDDGILVKILIEMSPTGLAEWDILTGDITDAFNHDRPENWKKDVRTIARRLKALGVKTKLVGGKSRTFLKTDVLNTLSDQYGFLTPKTTHETHGNTQPPESVGDLCHELQHEFPEAKRNSCGNSCPQDADNIGKSELHELHESICTQEDDVIEITDLEGAEVKK